MGVVNVTPDSFSDGGAWYGTDDAVRHGLDLAAQGADLVDVGGESTRPGAQRVPEDEELRRVIPVIGSLAAAGLAVSVDTMRASVAAAAVQAGACMVNDVSGGLADAQMAPLVASAGVAYVVVHWRGHSRDMMQRAVYQDVVAEVSAELAARVDAAVAAGVDPGRIIIDPGLGFAKRPAHNWALLRGLAEVASLGRSGRVFPVLVGASRKRFLGKLLAGPDGSPRPFAGCEGATVAVTALAAAAGAWAVRVHDAAGNADAVRVASTWAGQPRDSGQSVPDRIMLRGLRVHARHGVNAQERRDGQEFVIDAELSLDTRAAAAADDLARTVDYGALAGRLAAAAAGEPVRLIETLAERLALVCLAEPAVSNVEITVHKPQAPVQAEVGDIAVSIRRERP